MPRPAPDAAGPRIDVRDLLNAQTGRIGWEELQRPFARGQLLLAAPDLDLIDVAARLVEDNHTAVADWTASGRLLRPGLDQARDWQNRQARFWAVVVAPWVLVQEITAAPH
jgi:hypothetical protein